MAGEIERVFVPTVRDVCVRHGQSTGTKNCSGFDLVKNLKLVVTPINGLDLDENPDTEGMFNS